ncbi:DUF998 domain-containing protein [soil metagenome]
MVMKNPLNNYIGPLLWIFSIQYFVAQVIVMRAWEPGTFSLRGNTISDLGNTTCGTYAGRVVCSPRHGLMNVSFILLGVCMFFGALGIYRLVGPRTLHKLGYGTLALAGIGTIMVGLFPENTIGLLHGIGASMPFLIGNTGMLILGVSTASPRWLRIYTFASGAFALVALILFVTGAYSVLGIGGTERLTAYPQTIWLMVCGLYYLPAFRQKANLKRSTV